MPRLRGYGPLGFVFIEAIFRYNNHEPNNNGKAPKQRHNRKLTFQLPVSSVRRTNCNVSSVMFTTPQIIRAAAENDLET